MTRLMTISDLHVNKQTSEEMQAALLQIAGEQGVNLLVIAGDISDDVKLTQKFVRELNLSLRTYYVPGNHDLWNIINKDTTANIYQQFCDDEYCLLNKTLVVSDKTVIIGHIGWYDYSFAMPKFTLAALERKKHNDIIWEDTKYIDFGQDDISLCRAYNQEIRDMLAQHEDKQKVLITHMVNHEKFLVKYTKRRDWTYFQGYLGSYELQELAKAADYAICGHVHYRAAFREDDTMYVCSCLGTNNEWQYFLKDQPLVEQVAHASFFVNLV